MGEVYLARDVQLDRTVAIKILPESVAEDRTRLQRFIQEAKAASALNHPHILTIYEIGTADNSQFIATEFIDGETLRQRLATPMKLVDILEISVQICSALCAAHEAGIVHRDIKPENIMVRKDGYSKLLDFGLAKLTELPTSIASSQSPTKALINTEPGAVMGTASYMSPEQAKGIKLDERTDIWSFGVVLYEMATSHLPFAGETSAETISLILQREPTPLSRFNPDLPAELERIVNKSLTKDREQRYQTAKDLLIDLRILKRKLEIDEEIKRTAADLGISPSTNGGSNNCGMVDSTASKLAVSASTISSAEYIFSGLRRHILAAVVAIALLVGLAALLATRLQRDSARPPIDSIAVLPFEDKSADADSEYISDGLTESLIYRLSQLPNLRVSPTSVVFRYKGNETDPASIGKQLGVSAVLSGRITQRSDNLTISAELVDVTDNKLLWGEQYDRKVSDLLATQREIAREIVDKLKIKVSGEEKALAKHYTENNEAYQLYLRGRFYWNKRTEEGMRKALDYYQQAIERDPNFALAYSGIADCYNLLGAAEAGGGLSPNEALSKAKVAALKALQIDETLAEPHVSLAHIEYLYDRDWIAAEREFKRAIELDPHYVMAHQWYALYLLATGAKDQAVSEGRRAVELDPLSLPANMTLGWVLSGAGQVDQAIEQLQKTLELDPNFVLAHHRLGIAYEQKRMFGEAITEFQKVFSLTGGKPLAIAALGHVYALAGKDGEARKSIKKLEEQSKQQWVAPTYIAMIYAALRDNDEAFIWLEKAFKENDNMLGRLNAEPRFDPLRSDPRFDEFLRRIRVPHNLAGLVRSNQQ